MTGRPLELSVFTGLKAAFSDSSLPFKVDVLDGATLAEDFRRRIEAGSIVIQEAAAEPA